jgi:hypothetical protein
MQLACRHSAQLEYCISCTHTCIFGFLQLNNRLDTLLPTSRVTNNMQQGSLNE